MGDNKNGHWPFIEHMFYSFHDFRTSVLIHVVLEHMYIEHLFMRVRLESIYIPCNLASSVYNVGIVK